MAKVTVYSTQSCPFCHMAKDYLKEHNVEFEDVDVNANQKGLSDMVKKSGQSAVPVIDIDGKILIGFNEQAIKEALKL